MSTQKQGIVQVCLEGLLVRYWGRASGGCSLSRSANDALAFVCTRNCFLGWHELYNILLVFVCPWPCPSNKPIMSLAAFAVSAGQRVCRAYQSLGNFHMLLSLFGQFLLVSPIRHLRALMALGSPMVWFGAMWFLSHQWWELSFSSSVFIFHTPFSACCLGNNHQY